VTRHSTPKEWQKRYGAARRAIDRALLEEAERRIASLSSIEDDIREAISREFSGRYAKPNHLDRPGGTWRYKQPQPSPRDKRSPPNPPAP
jgi:hypothetical protein